jgi:hypothetical protein
LARTVLVLLLVMLTDVRLGKVLSTTTLLPLVVA